MSHAFVPHLTHVFSAPVPHRLRLNQEAKAFMQESNAGHNRNSAAPGSDRLPTDHRSQGEDACTQRESILQNHTSEWQEAVVPLSNPSFPHLAPPPNLPATRGCCPVAPPAVPLPFPVAELVGCSVALSAPFCFLNCPSYRSGPSQFIIYT